MANRQFVSFKKKSEQLDNILKLTSALNISIFDAQYLINNFEVYLLNDFINNLYIEKIKMKKIEKIENIENMIIAFNATQTKEGYANYYKIKNKIIDELREFEIENNNTIFDKLRKNTNKSIFDNLKELRKK